MRKRFGACPPGASSFSTPMASGLLSIRRLCARWKRPLSVASGGTFQPLRSGAIAWRDRRPRRRHSLRTPASNISRLNRAIASPLEILAPAPAGRPATRARAGAHATENAAVLHLAEIDVCRSRNGLAGQLELV